MKKVMTIVGARPQFIKAAVVSRAFNKNNDITEMIVHTGQHYDDNMSKIFFDELAIPRPHYHLGVGSSLHGEQTANMLIGLEKLLKEEKPNLVLIYGDTNSTLAGALAAAKLHIPIAHVEAGLRSYNRKMPEEINRLVADQLSEVLFTPTKQAVTNLKNEGFKRERIVEVGDVMYDAALFYAKIAQEKSNILNNFDLTKKKYILATIHRAENTDDLFRLKTIFYALNKLSLTYPIIMPIHPRTKKLLDSLSLDLDPNFKVVDPVGFLEMVMLEKNAALIMTDSGGVQKEAFFYGVPCITLRDETEWTETVELGWNTLVRPNDKDLIYHTAMNKMTSKGDADQTPFGQGDAGSRIAAYLQQGNLT